MAIHLNEFKAIFSLNFYTYCMKDLIYYVINQEAFHALITEVFENILTPWWQ